MARSVTNAIFAINLELLFLLLEKRYEASWQAYAAQFSRSNGEDYVQEAKIGLFETIKESLVLNEEIGFPNGKAISAFVRKYIYFRAKHGWRKAKAWKKLLPQIAKADFFSSNDEELLPAIAAIDVPVFIQEFCCGKSEVTQEIVWRRFAESQTLKEIRESLGQTRFRVLTVIAEFKNFCERKK